MEVNRKFVTNTLIVWVVTCQPNQWEYNYLLIQGKLFSVNDGFFRNICPAIENVPIYCAGLDQSGLSLREIYLYIPKALRKCPTCTVKGGGACYTLRLGLPEPLFKFRSSLQASKPFDRFRSNFRYRLDVICPRSQPAYFFVILYFLKQLNA